MAILRFVFLSVYNENKRNEERMQGGCRAFLLRKSVQNPTIIFDRVFHKFAASFLVMIFKDNIFLGLLQFLLNPVLLYIILLWF